MLRTFNYTGRRRIKQAEASFKLDNNGVQPPRFSAEIILDEGSYPENASVYIDAWYRETRQRFFFGNVGRIVPPASTDLDVVEITDGIQFRVLVVDETGKHALLLGSGIFRVAGDDTEDQNRRNLVSVVAKDLGSLPWKVEFDEESKPTLCVNRDIPNPIEKMRTDPTFQALVLPAAMRDILRRIMFSEEVDDDSEIYRQWLSFVLNFTDQKPSECDEYDMQRWIEEVVDEFCERFDFVEKLSSTFKESN